MNLPNALGAVIGIFAIYCGVKNKSGYNDVDCPLSERERDMLNRPVTLLDRFVLIGIGLLMVLLAFLGKFSSW